MSKPYRGPLSITERLAEAGPLPSMNRISQDRADALAEIERLKIANEAQRESLKVAYDTISDKNWRLATIRGALDANSPSVNEQKSLAYEQCGHGNPLGACTICHMWEQVRAMGNNQCRT